MAYHLLEIASVEENTFIDGLGLYRNALFVYMYVAFVSIIFHSGVKR